MVKPPRSIEELVEASELVVTAIPRKRRIGRTRHEVVEVLKGDQRHLYLLDKIDWGVKGFDQLHLLLLSPSSRPEDVDGQLWAYSVDMPLRQVRRLLAGFTANKPVDNAAYLAHEADVIVQGAGQAGTRNDTVIVTFNEASVLKGKIEPEDLHNPRRRASIKPPLKAVEIRIPYGHIVEFQAPNKYGMFFLSRDETGKLASMTDSCPWDYTTTTAQADVDRWLATPKPEERRPPERSRYDHGQENAPPPPPGPAPE